MTDPEMFLHEMGFSDYEAAAYLALLQNGKCTANEVAQSGDIPQSRVYDILEKLENKGFVVTQPGRPKKFGAVEPEGAIEQYGEYRQQQFESEIEKVMLAGEQFVDAVERTTETRATSDEPDIVWSYHTEHQMFEVFEQLCRESTDEVRMLTRAANIERKVGRLDELLAAISEEGVRIRVVLPAEQSLSGSIRDSLTDYAELAHSESVQAQIYLFDAENVLVVFRNDDQFVGLTVQNGALGETLAGLFDTLWASATPEPAAISD